MGTTLTPDNLPAGRPAYPKGHDTQSLGPGDSSDSGSDMAGTDVDDEDVTEAELAGGEETADASDISPEHVVEAEEAGLGGGLDQAEEAQLGVTNEQLDEAIRDAKAHPKKNR
jgi:hypothetical protein